MSWHDVCKFFTEMITFIEALARLINPDDSSDLTQTDTPMSWN